MNSAFFLLYLDVVIKISTNDIFGLPEFSLDNGETWFIIMQDYKKKEDLVIYDRREFEFGIITPERKNNRQFLSNVDLQIDNLGTNISFDDYSFDEDQSLYLYYKDQPIPKDHLITGMYFHNMMACVAAELN